MERLPKISNPQNPKLPSVPDTDKLERETVGNVIINCLANHMCQDRKEGFYVNLIAQSVIAKGSAVELKDNIKEFLIEVLDDSIMRQKVTKDEKGNEKKEMIGLYAGWVISQVLDELGVKEV
jgi:hypothetical protein